MQEKTKSYPFLALNLPASFAEGSPGRAARRVINQHGAKKLTGVVWEAGHVAYKYLENHLVGGTSPEGYKACVSAALAFLRDSFFPDIVQMIESGRVSLSNGSSEDFVATWREYDWVERLKVFLQVADHANAQSGNEITELDWSYKVYVAAALLQRIDDAIMSSHMDNEGLVESVVNIVEFRDRLSPPSQQQLTIEAAVGAARKQIGRKGAAAKLARDPKQKAKSAVRECWALWQKDPNRYSGPTAFATDMLDKFDALENIDVVMRWNREWKKEVT